jgi:hypothetical protein
MPQPPILVTESVHKRIACFTSPPWLNAGPMSKDHGWNQIIEQKTGGVIPRDAKPLQNG